MKKLICTLLSAILILTLAACAEESGKPTNPAAPNGGHSEQQSAGKPVTDTEIDHPSNGTPTLVWKTEEIDDTGVLPELKTQEFNVINDVTTCRVQSPIDLNEETLVNAILQTDYCKNMVVKKRVSEKLSNQYYDDEIGVRHSYQTDVYYKFYDSAATHESDYEFELYIYRESYTVDGISGVGICFKKPDVADDELQNKIAEVAKAVFGDEVSHVLVYKKSSDADMPAEELHLEYTNTDENGKTNTWRLTRTMEDNYDGHTEITMNLLISSDVYNYFSWTPDTYQSIVKDCTFDFGSLFPNQLGDIPDLTGESFDAMKNYFSVGEAYHPYKGTLLTFRTYAQTELLDGGMEYELQCTWEKESQLGVLSSLCTSIRCNFEISTDKDGAVTKYSYTLNGQPDIVDTTNDAYDAATMLAPAEQAVEYLKQELKIVFGDGIDVNELTAESFPVEYSEDGHANRDRYLELPVAINLFGKDVEATVYLKLTGDEESPDWWAYWGFSYIYD